MAGIALVVIVAGCASVPRNQSSSKPGLTLEEMIYDFKYAGPGQIISHVFNFYNAENTPIGITAMSVCCGCDAQIQPTLPAVLEPDKQGQVEINCTMPRFDGPVEKVINLHTDYGENHSIPLTIRGVVRRDIALIPSALFFGILKKGQTAQKRIRVFQMSNERLIVRRVEANAAYYRIETIRFDEPNHRGYDIVVNFTANLSPGTYSDLLSIHTNDLRRPVIDVPIVAQVIE